MPRKNQIPSYRRHKSGQARVTLNGHDVLLGKFGSAASKDKYNQVVGEWIASGKQPAVKTVAAERSTNLTISELIARYKVHCEKYYRRPDGTPTGETDNIGDALRPLRLMYGKTSPADFSPLKLKALREAMIDPKIIDPKSTAKGWCRNLINHNVHRICAFFSWGVENELVPAEIPTGLREVKPLLRGRSEARESVPVQPVDDSIVEATIPHLPTVVAAMVRIQRLTAARPGEIIRMRTMDIDQTAAIWFYVPPQHKTAHHGRIRSVAIGPRAQELLKPYLKPLNPTAFMFCPADATAEMRDQRQQARKTPANQGNAAGTNRARKPRRQPGKLYGAKAIRRAVARACDVAFPVPADLASDPAAVKQWRREHRWHPNQLRHSAATEIERKLGMKASQTVLGHSSANTTKTYVAENQTAAGRVAAEVG